MAGKLWGLDQKHIPGEEAKAKKPPKDGQRK